MTEFDNVSYHFGASSEEYCDGLRVLALLDHEHPVFGRAERHLANHPGGTQLVRGELLEAGNDPAAGGDCNELDLGTADPSGKSNSKFHHSERSSTACERMWFSQEIDIII